MRFLPFRSLVWSSGFVIFLVGCGGGTATDSPQSQPDAQGQTDSPPQTQPDAQVQPDSRVLPIPDPICPGTRPSGACESDSLRCGYQDEMGCPVLLACIAMSYPNRYWDEQNPPPGDACSAPGKICEYQTGREGVPQWNALRCGDAGRWEKHDLCPSSVPPAGASCEHPYLSCNFGRCPGIDAPIVSAQCNPTPGTPEKGTWSVIRFCNEIQDGG